ncbi:MAG: hypothetical protein ACW990_05150 [Promethearchaeota archaeon]|jgi:hypothetical protein
MGIYSTAFQPIFLLSTGFIVLFLPSYPIFFIISKNIKFNLLEKLSLTIIISAVFYILSGYLGFIFRIPITGFFFFGVLSITYFSIISFVIYCEITKGSYNFIRSIETFNSIRERAESFSLIRYIKVKIPINGCLLIIFITFICFLNIVRVSIFAGTDPWLHIFNSKIITQLNYLPLGNYHKTMGLNIFEAVISFFSGINHILIPRYFVFYTFFVSGLIFYNISMRIFKNRTLALFSVFVLEFSSLGFSTMMLQYWPSGFSLIMFLMIFFLLYVRLQKLIKTKRPSKQDILSDLPITYLLIFIIFVGAVLTHIITSLIFLISFLWLYIIYFFKDRNRGIDFLFLCVLFGISIVLINLGVGSGQFGFFTINISWYYLLMVGSAGSVAGVIILWKLQKSILFTKGRYKSIIKGETKSYYKLVGDRIIIPLFFTSIILITILLLIINLVWLNFATINILNITEILLLSSFAIVGLFLFQKKPRGKPLYLWGFGLALLLAIGFILNLLIFSNMIWQRILYLIPPIIVIGFTSYIYKLVKTNSIRLSWIKIVLLATITFSLFTTYLYESVSHDIFNMKKSEVNTILWYDTYSSKQNIILTEFGWGYVFNFYDFPFYDKNEAFYYNANIYILTAVTDLFPPNSHINESGVNLLREIKEKHNSDVYLIFEDDYLINRGFKLFGRLTPEETEKYYSLSYLNRICSSKSESGEIVPLYWVI